jgi:hypothetical protein
MNNGIPTNSAHSADVRMHLHVNGHVIPIAQMGPNFLIVHHSIDHSPALAEIHLSIDGTEDSWSVLLPEGLQSGRRRVFIESSAGSR